ncbi:CBS domain-containing protein [Rhizobium sp. PL01]|jgi:CBS domain-containing protein|uniref:CBS domain-containing protein n=1 Tax=Rhizobium sp. PL01 TaxID=3085631 RepID=UPI00298197D8|nr:CBS domain-containing protein [Rhizobium sp. PL01]MDW5313939.1 CBS domain-containing protein [Rhizobium sp. PL01]
MSVKAILNEKGRQVVTVDPQAKVRQAVALLSEHRIGAVIIVKPGDKIAGILTERDVVAAMAKFGADCLDKTVSAVMWSKVYSCTEDMSINDIMEIMNNMRARHLPVEKNGRLVGIVSIGDAVRHHIRAIEHEAEQIKAYIAG